MIGLGIGLLLTVVSLPIVQSQLFTAVFGVVNDAVTLPCGTTCLSEAEWTIFFPKNDVVATCRKGQCEVMGDYQKRFTFPENTTSGNISLLIRPVVYNDIGSYKCSCDGKEYDVKLKVFVPVAVTARELETVTLPCYGDTREDAKDVQWKRGGQKVLLYDRLSSTVTTGEEFKGRLVLSKEAVQDGDLSLHISSVQQSDAGLYMCSFHDEFREGEPRAVLLKVEVQIPVFQLQTSTVIGVIVNEPTSLPCFCSGEARWTRSGPTKAIIAHCSKGACKVEDGFQKRFSFSRHATTGNISLLIESLVYSDIGSYSCNCDGKVTQVKLKALGAVQSRYCYVVFILFVLVLVTVIIIIRTRTSRPNSTTPEDAASSYQSRPSPL